LFLPWEKNCGSGVCFSANGWSSTNGSMAGGLAVLLAAILLGASAFLGELALGLLGLTALELIYERGEIGWEDWASVVLCLLLVALGWLERNGGLEKLLVPEEIWRFDRLPDAES
jgi:hypothetical protein